jgi:hypothetical protein
MNEVGIPDFFVKCARSHSSTFDVKVRSKRANGTRRRSF